MFKNRMFWGVGAMLAGVMLSAQGACAAEGQGGAAQTSVAAALMGYTAGAQVVKVTPVQAQIDTISGIIYHQAFSLNSVRQLRMTIMVPRTTVKKPALVYLPGGGFTTAAWEKFIELRTALAREGFVVAAAEYRTVPDKFPALLEDAKAAVRYLRANAERFNIDADHIGVIGDSAGGYLSMMTACTNGERKFDVGENLEFSSAVQAAVSFYGISDLRSIGEGLGAEIEAVHHSPAVTEALLVHGPAFNTFAGADIFSDPQKADEASPLHHVDGNEPPMLLLHGAQDKLVSPLQSVKLFKALQERGEDAQYILVENAAHGDAPWYQDAVIDKVVQFCKDKLGTPGKSAASGGTL